MSEITISRYRSSFLSEESENLVSTSSVNEVEPLLDRFLLHKTYSAMARFHSYPELDTNNDFHLLESSVEVLSEAIRGYKRLLDYNGMYIAYLMEQMTEEEFHKEAKEFIATPVDIPLAEACRKVQILIANSKAQFTPSEIANILNIEDDVVEEALDLLELNGAI